MRSEETIDEVVNNPLPAEVRERQVERRRGWSIGLPGAFEHW